MPNARPFSPTRFTGMSPRRLARIALNRTVCLASLLFWSTSIPTRVVAQENRTHETAIPRAVLDSSFAARALITRLAEQIRRGEPDVRVGSDARLGLAMRRVAAAASARIHQPQRPELGVLWDFLFDDIEIEATGPGRLIVRATAGLATDAAPRTPIILVVERAGGEWVLGGQEGLVPLLDLLARRFATRVVR